MHATIGGMPAGDVVRVHSHWECARFLLIPFSPRTGCWTQGLFSPAIWGRLKKQPFETSFAMKADGASARCFCERRFTGVIPGRTGRAVHFNDMGVIRQLERGCRLWKGVIRSESVLPVTSGETKCGSLRDPWSRQKRAQSCSEIRQLRESWFSDTLRREFNWSKEQSNQANARRMPRFGNCARRQELQMLWSAGSWASGTPDSKDRYGVFRFVLLRGFSRNIGVINVPTTEASGCVFSSGTISMLILQETGIHCFAAPWGLFARG